MKKFLVIFTLLFNIGCVTTGLFSDTGAGTLFSSQTEGGGLGIDRGSLNKGKSCCHNILGWAVFGDCSIKASKKDGDLKSVSFYDKEIFRVLSLYGRFCTITHGPKKNSI